MSIFGFYQVPQGHTVVLERFGQFVKTLSPGWHLVTPCTTSPKSLADWEGVASKCNYFMELTEQQIETKPRKCQTRDSVSVDASATINFKIYDPEKAVYAIDKLPQAIQEICLNVLRSQIGQHSFDEIFSKRAEISKKITDELNDKVHQWGVKLIGVEVGSLEYSKEIDQALQKKRVAQAEKDARLIAIETDSLAAIRASETQLKKKELDARIRLIETTSEAEAALIKAKNQAEAVRIESAARVQAYAATKEAESKHLNELVNEVGKDGAVHILASQKAVEGMTALSSNNNHKLIMLPTDFKGMVKLVGLDNLNVDYTEAR